MEQGKRQIQIAKVIKKEMIEIFAKEGYNIISNNGMVSVSDVRITPDLYEARIYLSFFQIADADEMLSTIKEKTSEWRGHLGNRLKNSLRRIPTLTFFKDDTLEHVFKMEELFKQLEEDKKRLEELRSQNKTGE
ncbi:MAG: ribosome-binding factor RbfA [Bacteroidota bacterium]|jgi:ribosome-binding factor A